MLQIEKFKNPCCSYIFTYSIWKLNHNNFLIFIFFRFFMKFIKSDIFYASLSIIFLFLISGRRSCSCLLYVDYSSGRHSGYYSCHSYPSRKTRRSRRRSSKSRKSFEFIFIPFALILIQISNCFLLNMYFKSLRL